MVSCITKHAEMLACNKRNPKTKQLIKVDACTASFQGVMGWLCHPIHWLINLQGFFELENRSKARCCVKPNFQIRIFKARIFFHKLKRLLSTRHKIDNVTHVKRLLMCLNKQIQEMLLSGIFKQDCSLYKYLHLYDGGHSASCSKNGKNGWPRCVFVFRSVFHSRKL